jgi:flagellar hook-basal body complex protein FliE
MINKISGNPQTFNGLQTEKNVQSDAFKQTLNNFLEEVNGLQVEDEQTTEAFLKGEITDLHQVSVAAQKARVSLELLLQIRNKLLESYQEIMRMQV